MYVCMNVCMYVCVRARARVRLRVRAIACVGLHMCLCRHMAKVHEIGTSRV